MRRQRRAEGGVTTPIAAEFLAWRTGKVWSRWHLTDPDWPLRTLCNLVPPKEASVTHQPGLLSSDDLCRSCLEVFSRKGT